VPKPRSGILEVEQRVRIVAVLRGMTARAPVRRMAQPSWHRGLAVAADQRSSYGAHKKSYRALVQLLCFILGFPAPAMMPRSGDVRMIQLFTWPTPNGQKVQIMLEEIGAPYGVTPINILQGSQFAPDFLAISPNNKIPAITDDGVLREGVPVSVFETGAILLYLAEKYGKFLPGDRIGRTETLEWLFFQCSSLGADAGQATHFRRYAKESVAYAVERYTTEANASLWCAGAAACRARLDRWWRLQHRRHGDVSLDLPASPAGADAGYFPRGQRLARQSLRTSRRRARHGSAERHRDRNTARRSGSPAAVRRRQRRSNHRQS